MYVYFIGSVQLWYLQDIQDRAVPFWKDSNRFRQILKFKIQFLYCSSFLKRGLWNSVCCVLCVCTVHTVVRVLNARILPQSGVGLYTVYHESGKSAMIADETSLYSTRLSY